MPLVRAALVPLLLAPLLLVAGPAEAAPEGQLTWGVHITLAPTWFDPAEASGMITPFMVYYALHDAMVMPHRGGGAWRGRGRRRPRKSVTSGPSDPTMPA